MANFNINISAKVIDAQNIIGESVLAGDILYLSNNGKYYKATASNPLKYKTELRLALSSGQADDIIDLLTYGYYDFGNSILIPGNKMYLSTTAGSITNTQYLNTNNGIRYIGTCYSDSILLFNPDQTYINSNEKTINDIPFQNLSSEYQLNIVNDVLTFSKDGVEIFNDDLNRYYDDTNLTRIVSAYYDNDDQSNAYKNIILVRDDNTRINIDLTDIIDKLDNHIADTTNPHNVTKDQVGLDQVDNTSDLNKPISTATQTALDNKVNNADLGTAAYNNTEDFATAAQGTLADTAIQPGDNISTLTDDIGILTETEAASTYQPILLLGDRFYIDEDGVLKDNIKSFAQQFVYTATDYPDQIFSLLEVPKEYHYVNRNGVGLHDSEFDYTYDVTEDRLKILVPLEEGEIIKVKYEYYINTPI